ncbi:UvrD-helicase domain-containing protein [Myroides odoratimimus]|uniref:UvrD-helicase domain-containing protein n=1 Tax=Myroides odoratimimus TaxID=76832 RepID=UPI0025784A7A|nr:UvrD-helicase domain-containing protein [Myroides odoratimimus]MDM1093695.1 DEAD/DEAH box helicase [Myroides odoratimimus]
MQYFMGKEIHSQIQSLRKRGGQYNKASVQATDIILKINDGKSNPLESLSVTKNGETRIKKCIKYDLSGYVRLVTIQDNGICLLAFLGDHDETDRWLDSKKGLNLTINPASKTLVSIQISEDINIPEERINVFSDYSEGLLYQKLDGLYFNVIADQLSHSMLSPFLLFDSLTDEETIIAECMKIKDKMLQEVYFDVFSHLVSGDIDQAKNRILYFQDELKSIDSINKEEDNLVHSNDQFLNIQELEGEYLKGILETKGWYEWMAFLHPDQKNVVNMDFSGSARLLGVSGSGKTSVLVHRAIRLAETSNSELPILVLTLNDSLSKLINSLVSLILETKNKEEIKTNIEVISFWQLCKKLILEKNRNNEFINRILNSITEKTGENIDEIWSEYYHMENNNDDAKVLFPIHQNLLARNINPEDYVRQEFDWIRSAFSKQDRLKYLEVEREGRVIPLNKEDREIMISGLEAWQLKMPDVGAVDYLELSSMLYEYIDELKPIYSHILVDEVQDFGTIELEIIRRLVENSKNDLFLCGDIAQQVYNKQHKLRNANINILPEGYLKILKNYRNSREILIAANAILQSNIDIEKNKSDDFEILNPEFANFSSPLPFLRKGESFIEELLSSIKYLEDNLDVQKKEKGCIAVCGKTFFNVMSIGKDADLPLLSQGVDLGTSKIFLSDLEQTKGFEFDKVIIINCIDSDFPNKQLPSEEWFREISKLYVAMTRAKKELIISYHDKYSNIIENNKKYFTEDQWSSHVDVIEVKEMKKLKELKEEFLLKKKYDLNLTGKEFLYSSYAIGISRELQNKIIEIVGGKTVIDHNGNQIGYKEIKSLKDDILKKKNWPNLTRLFGSKVLSEFENLCLKL